MAEETKVSARERVKQMQAESEKKNRSSSLVFRIFVVLLSVAVVGGIVFLSLNVGGSGNGAGDDEASTSGPAPAAANTSGGITLASSTETEEGDDLGTVDATDVPAEGKEVDVDEDTPHIVIYADPNCVHCATFEAQNAEAIERWLDAGDVTVEYRMISYLDSGSSTNYSSRANNALMCMADESEENFLGYMTDIFAMQGEELSNDDMVQMAQEDHGTDISSCVNDGTYRGFISYATQEAQQSGVEGTPSVLLDNENWQDSGMGFEEWVESKI